MHVNSEAEVVSLKSHPLEGHEVVSEELHEASPRHAAQGSFSLVVATLGHAVTAAKLADVAQPDAFLQVPSSMRWRRPAAM